MLKCIESNSKNRGEIMEKRIEALEKQLKDLIYYHDRTMRFLSYAEGKIEAILNHFKIKAVSCNYRIEKTEVWDEANE